MRCALVVVVLLLLAREHAAEVRSVRAKRVAAVASRSGGMKAGATAATTTSVRGGEVILIQVKSLELKEGERRRDMETPGLRAIHTT